MNIKKFLKKEAEPERKLIQARIDADLYDRLRAKLKKDEIEIREFFEAAARAYLEK